MSCKFYMNEIVVVDHPLDIALVKIVGHEIYQDRIGYKIEFHTGKIFEETIFYGNDEEFGEMQIRKANAEEIKLFKECCKEYNNLELKKFEIDDKIDNQIKF